MKKKSTVPARWARPRNPLVAVARFRRAGSHQPTSRGVRQSGRRQLARDLDALARSP